MGMQSVSVLCTLSVLLSWPQVNAHVCDGTCDMICDIHGCILPSKPFSYIGEDLVLNCTLRDLNFANSSMLYFTYGNDLNMSSAYQRVISPYVLELRVPVPDERLNEVTVGCVARGVNITAFWRSRVRVDYPLREVTNFSVVVNNWSNMSITWHIYTYLYPPSVTTYWTVPGNQSTWQACEDSGLSWCFLGPDSYQEDKLYEVRVNISSNNNRVQASVSSTFHFNSGEHVQSGPVSRLEVVGVDSRCVDVEWTHTQSHSRNLTYRITLHSSSKFYENQTDQLKTSGRTSEQVCELRPDTEYRVSVSVRPAQGGLWSDSRSVNCTTLQDYPEVGAMTTQGGFVEDECQDDVRTVDIYLVPPDEFYWNGRLTHYTLVYVPSDASSNISYTAEIDAVYQRVNLSCSLQYDVYISVNNKIGGSPPSHLHIPRQNKVSEARNVALEKNNTKYELVFDDAQVQPLSLTLFWCPGSFSLCEGRLSWRPMNKSNGGMTIDYDSINIYGIALRSDDGSSGISWVECIYDVEDVPDPPIPPSVESRPDHGLTLSWGVDSCPGNTFLSTYTIQYCTSGHLCRDTTLASEYSEYVIRGLEGGVNYTVRMRQMTVSGKQGPFSRPVFAVTLGLTKTEITGIGVGSALGAIILLIFLLGCGRHMWLNYNRKETITLPKISEGCVHHVDSITIQDYSLRPTDTPPALPPSRIQWRTSQEQRGTSQEQRITSLKQQGTSWEHRGTSREHRGTSREQRGRSQEQRGTTREQRGTSQEQRDGGDTKPAGVLDSGLCDTRDWTAPSSEVQATDPGFWGSANPYVNETSTSGITDHGLGGSLDSSTSVDPYVTAATDEDNHVVDEDEDEDEEEDKNIDCVVSDIEFDITIHPCANDGTNDNRDVDKIGVCEHSSVCDRFEQT